jgi:hypothetical protein
VSPRRSLKRSRWPRSWRAIPLNGRHRSLGEIAAELKAAGHVTSKGTPYGAAAIARNDRVRGAAGSYRASQQ